MNFDRGRQPANKFLRSFRMFTQNPMMLNVAHIRNGRFKIYPNITKELRIKKGLTQELLAEKFDEKRMRISLSSIKRIEGGNNVSLRVLNGYAAYFNLLLDIAV